MKSFNTLEKEISRALDLISDLRRENETLRSRVKAMQEGESILNDLKKENFALQKKQEVLKLKVEKIIQKLNSIKPGKEDEAGNG